MWFIFGKFFFSPFPVSVIGIPSLCFYYKLTYLRSYTPDPCILYPSSYSPPPSSSSSTLPINNRTLECWSNCVNQQYSLIWSNQSNKIKYAHHLFAPCFLGRWDLCSHGSSNSNKCSDRISLEMQLPPATLGSYDSPAVRPTNQSTTDRHEESQESYTFRCSNKSHGPPDMGYI